MNFSIHSLGMPPCVKQRYYLDTNNSIFSSHCSLSHLSQPLQRASIVIQLDSWSGGRSLWPKGTFCLYGRLGKWCFGRHEETCTWWPTIQVTRKETPAATILMSRNRLVLMKYIYLAFSWIMDWNPKIKNGRRTAVKKYVKLNTNFYNPSPNLGNYHQNSIISSPKWSVKIIEFWW